MLGLIGVAYGAAQLGQRPTDFSRSLPQDLRCSARGADSNSYKP